MADTKDFKETYGPWVLITGTTSGIGKAFADQLASRGLNLILVARRKEILEKQAKDLESNYKIKAQTIQADLSEPNTVELLIDATQELEIGLFIPNAGVEYHGNFTENKIEDESKLLQINITAPMQLAHHFGGKMVTKGRGGILFISSVGAYGIGPYMANYTASKAYILSLGESLHYEMKSKGVDVTVLSPGPTDTAMLAGTGFDVDQMGMKPMSPEEVASIGLNALGKKSSIIPGTTNNIMSFVMNRLMPSKVTHSMIQKMMAKAYNIN